MRRYSQEEEEKIRAQRLVREWTQSGLLEEPQGARLAEELRVELRRTNPFLRAGLALFTGLIVAASVTLLITFLNLRGDVPIAATTGLAALTCIGLAEYLVHEFRCYRFGVEEALAVAAVGLLSIAGGELTSSFHLEPRGMPATVALLIAGAGGFGLYRRFGFVYAACGGIFCVAAIPFQLDLSAATQRILAAATIASVLLVARSKRLKYRDDYPGDEYGLMQAAALAGVYVVLNVQLTDWYRVDQPFYGFTYALTWALPLAGLALAIRGKGSAADGRQPGAGACLGVDEQGVPGLATTRVGPMPARRPSDRDCLRDSPVAVERARWRTPRIHRGAAPREGPRGSVGGRNGFRLHAAGRERGRRFVTSRACTVGLRRRPVGWGRGSGSF